MLSAMSRDRAIVMTNGEVARVFNQVADMMELKDENIFKVNAFRKAGRVIENLTESIGDIHNEGKLLELPGIGKGLMERIEQLLNTGTCKDYQELKKQIPPGLMDILNVPEVGPKTAQLVWKKLKVANLDGLEKAAKEGKLRDLFRMGEKKESNILRGIELLRKSKGRLLLGEALPIAETFVSALKKLKEVVQISVCGSLRRSKETIGDVDILITSKTPKKVMDAFVKMPQVMDVLAHGETKSSILTKSGLQVDLRVVEESSFGAALQYFTGSKEHNVALRELAQKKELKINEYGVFKEKGNKKLAGKTEQEVYAAVGLAWIPPELRENMGEIEAAKNSSIPELLKDNNIQGDLHVHTDWSDGAFPIEDVVESLRKKGYAYGAVTDHSKNMRIAHGLDEKRMLEQIKIIRELNKKTKGFQILTGTEVDIMPDGSLDFSDEVLSQLDVVVASVHSRFKMDKKQMTERICSALKNKNVDILGHPTGRLIGSREAYDVDMEKVLETAAETKTALEINAYPERLDLKDIYVKKAKELGCLIAISTDSHQKGQLEFMRYGAATARRGWLEKKNVLNCMGTDELLEWLKHRYNK